MPLEITVGAPQLLIHHGQTVFSAEPDGQVQGETLHGLMFRDTRLISAWLLSANGTPWDLLNGGAVSHFAARVFLTNRAFATVDGDVPTRSLALRLGRWISGGVHEDIDVTNHGAAAVRFNLELMVRADFADLFELRSGRTARRGRIATDWSEAAQCLTTTYTNTDFVRGLAIEARGDSRAAYANGRLSFEVALAPGATWHACLRGEIIDGAARLAAPAECDAEVSEAARDLAAWRARLRPVPALSAALDAQMAQAIEDVASLRLPFTEGGVTHVIAAAGLPWFLAPFGRDSLIVALQTLSLTDEFARGALAVLGARQAEAHDPARDAEPGKILHEQRVGELAHFHLIPHTPYFGTADATPLWLLVLHAAWKSTGDDGLLATHMATAQRCLDWIDRDGDRDGDLFQEYQTRAIQGGYENMGWKDAGDAVLHADGSRVVGPKALCELQAYVFAAWRGMAEIHAHLGAHDCAARLEARAALLFNRFNEVFWDEAAGTYLYALDGDKRPVRSVVSNVGHCLWAGIVRPDRARRVVERLMAEDMFSGWGIRTLSARHPGFNPFSYHNGSVWPHDNGFAALGFARYGFDAEARRLAGAITAAAGFFAGRQLPELFAGLVRAQGGFPVQCLGANVPQAWAAGSAFALAGATMGWSGPWDSPGVHF